MNRDEKRTHPVSRPPRRKVLNPGAVLCPSEPGGGTWISLNDVGATLTLINWYSITARVVLDEVSRGEVVSSASAAGSPAGVGLALAQLPLHRINPFRLIGIFPATNEIVEWRWNLQRLVGKSHRWTSQQWISSGFDEPTARRKRNQTFRQAPRQRSTGSLDWLRRLHRSHAPACGPFSTCMHRVDAATVSDTEVTVNPRACTRRYYAGAPCKSSACFIHRHQLRVEGTQRSAIFACR